MSFFSNSFILKRKSKGKISFRKSDKQMNNWFKKLFGFEEHDGEQSTPHQRQQRTSNEQYRQNNGGPKQKMDAKVVYEYPRGNFRFPIIPDEDIQTGHNRKEARSYKKMEQIKKGNESVSYDQKNKNRDDSLPKRPFKPTEVPSPVFGFSKPVHSTEELAASVDSNPAIQIDEQKISFENGISNHSIYTNESMDVTYENMDVPYIDEHSPNINENSPIEMNSDQQIHDGVDESSSIEESYQDTLVIENIQPSINESERESEKNDKQQKKESSERQTVPFNVLMFKQDKQKISKNTIQHAIQDEAHYHRPTKPTLNLLDIPPVEVDDDQEWLQEQKQLLDSAFASFNVGAKVVNATKGPAVTQFEIQPEHGVRVNKITNLTDDLKLALAAKDIRIEAPIPGKSTVGIEVPNRKSRSVVIREILRSSVFQKNTSPLIVALGLDISGQPITTDIKKMPHGLIAGATGSGKSVCINSIIISLIYKASPHEVKLMLIDPKVVELAPYNGIPHLVSPVITDVKAATAALKWAVEEMERRYELFAHEGVRDITRFNEKVLKENPKAEIMPYLVIIIDELADLMMVSPADVEDAICRIAQKARACGIHLLLATQRPSVDVITGLIKANIPTRTAFSVSSQVDSRTIIDISGAEKLLGRGDMLFLENGSNKPVRIQGNFVSDEEIERVTEFVRKQMEPTYLFVQEELIKQSSDMNTEDELFLKACEFVIEQEGASASSLQRRFRIGYNRAARLIDMMEAQGIVSEPKGSKPRDVLVSKEHLEKL